MLANRFLEKNIAMVMKLFLDQFSFLCVRESLTRVSNHFMNFAFFNLNSNDDDDDDGNDVRLTKSRFFIISLFFYDHNSVISR
jgi:hypothetical protein